LLNTARRAGPEDESRGSKRPLLETLDDELLNTALHDELLGRELLNTARRIGSLGGELLNTPSLATVLTSASPRRRVVGGRGGAHRALALEPSVSPSVPGWPTPRQARPRPPPAAPARR
jgi:hypothetical protein